MGAFIINNSNDANLVIYQAEMRCSLWGTPGGLPNAAKLDDPITFTFTFPTVKKNEQGYSLEYVIDRNGDRVFRGTATTSTFPEDGTLRNCLVWYNTR